jgi:hypothetical protein
VLADRCSLGNPIGSVCIDEAMFDLIKPKLDSIQEHSSSTAEVIAWDMISARFERLKCAFGSETTHVPVWNLDVPCLDRTQSFPEADICNGQMAIG